MGSFEEERRGVGVSARASWEKNVAVTLLNAEERLFFEPPLEG